MRHIVTPNVLPILATDSAASCLSINEIRVGQGTYKPDQDEAGNVTLGGRAGV